MALSLTLARHRYVLQAGFVAGAVAACVLITDALAFRTSANIIWMLGLPVAVAIAANVGWDRRCFMAMALIGISLMVTMFVGVVFTSYG